MDSMPLLLVHGSCHGAWCWDRLLPELAARGIRAGPVDLPGQGEDRTPLSRITMRSTTEAVLEAARTLVGATAGKVALLGHSAGGYPISAAAMAAPGLVAKLIYLCAYLPRDGMSLAQMRREWPEQPLLPHIRRENDGLSYSFEDQYLESIFYHDCPADAVALARTKLRPQPLAVQSTPLSLTPDFHACAQHYILCRNDRAIPPGYQRRMSAHLPPGRVTELPASHSPFFSMPGLLAARIGDILAG